MSPEHAYWLGGYKFDGYKNGVLIEAKGPGYKRFINKDGSFKYWFEMSGGLDEFVLQARHQSTAAKDAGNLPVEWHVADIELVEPLRSLLLDNDIMNIRVIHTSYKL